MFCRPLARTAVAILMLGVLTACGDGDATAADGAGSPGGGAAQEAAQEASPTTASPTTTANPAPTTTVAHCTSEANPLVAVLVNDDGIANPAIDMMLDHLTANDQVHLDIVVVAPAEERSGSSDTTTPGGVTHQQATTPGGTAGYAVDGYPADAVLVALDDLGLEPHLVLSGINPGQNFGAFAPLSGTVGAARTAARNGVPALAVSAGFDADPSQFEVGATLALDWIVDHCEALMAGDHPVDTIASINVPACDPARMGPLQQVPRALEMPELPDGTNIFESTCDQGDPAPADDVAAVRAGYPSLTEVELDL